MAIGVLLTVTLFAGAALIVVGHFKPSRRMQRAGWMVVIVWLLPAVPWAYYLQVLTEQDRYRTLSESTVLYGVPLPAGAQVNYRRWARRVQWANLPAPQTIDGVDYAVQVNFCGRRVCSGTLARDQEIQGLPCRAQTEVRYSEQSGAVTGCTFARPFSQQGVTWPAGTALAIGSANSYVLPEGAAPVAIQGLLVHSGLIVELTPGGRIAEIHRNQLRPRADTLLESAAILLKSEEYRFGPDGNILGGVLARDAVIGGKLTRAGEPVTLPQPTTP